MFVKLVAQMLLDERSNIHQALKPQRLCGFCGTAEAVPFQNSADATHSSPCSLP
jgi:hypothetical protein